MKGYVMPPVRPPYPWLTALASARIGEVINIPPGRYVLDASGGDTDGLGVAERASELREDGEVGMEPDSVDPPDSEGE
jgi:hypothetical protein